MNRDDKILAVIMGLCFTALGGCPDRDASNASFSHVGAEMVDAGEQAACEADEATRRTMWRWGREKCTAAYTDAGTVECVPSCDRCMGMVLQLQARNVCRALLQRGLY